MWLRDAQPTRKEEQPETWARHGALPRAGLFTRAERGYCMRQEPNLGQKRQ